MSKTPEELFNERTKRFEEAVHLKIPDKVPFLPSLSFFPAKYAGISFREAMYDYDKFSAALKKFYLDFQPDMYVNYFGVIAIGPVLEALGYKQLKWPGHGIDCDIGYQYVEAEYMKAEEYDDFLADPSGFMIRTFFPRIYGILEPLSTLPAIPWIHHFARTVSVVSMLGTPKFIDSFKSLVRAATEAQKMVSKASEFDKEMKALGFPCERRSAVYTPFDYIGDCLRGTRGIMLDMYRKPDKLLEAMERILPILIKQAAEVTKKTGNPVVLIPLHKGSDDFMSKEQFMTFYWPTLKRLMLGLIDEGAVPCPFFEGDFTSRLEIIGDIPKGKAIYRFGTTDIFKAKEVLGGHTCIRGNVPASLLCIGAPAEVKDYCKKLIDIIGKGGGFIMDGSAGIPDQARIENVKAMTDFTKEYGIYN